MKVGDKVKAHWPFPGRQGKTKIVVPTNTKGVIVNSTGEKFEVDFEKFGKQTAYYYDLELE